MPSLYISGDSARTWSVTRAAAYGAGIGALAALLKTFGPLHEPGAAAARVVEIAVAAIGFSVLCTGAATLRNLIARRLIWPELIKRRPD